MIKLKPPNMCGKSMKEQDFGYNDTIIGGFSEHPTTPAD
jgi:hypothetical protein